MAKKYKRIMMPPFPEVKQPKERDLEREFVRCAARWHGTVRHLKWTYLGTLKDCPLCSRRKWT